VARVCSAEGPMRARMDLTSMRWPRLVDSRAVTYSRTQASFMEKRGLGGRGVRGGSGGEWSGGEWSGGEGRRGRARVGCCATHSENLLTTASGYFFPRFLRNSSCTLGSLGALLAVFSRIFREASPNTLVIEVRKGRVGGVNFSEGTGREREGSLKVWKREEGERGLGLVTGLKVG